MIKKGFTLIEILIVIAILAIISGISMVALSSFNRYQALDKDAGLIVETLREARSKTLSSLNATTYGVHFATSTITQFVGSTYSTSSATNVVHNLRSPQANIFLSLNGSSTIVVFNRLTGETNQYGTIVLTGAGATTTKTITIYKTGVIQSK